MEARRALKVDLLCLLVLTPMAVLSVYLCSAGALQYLRENQVSFAIFTEDPSSLYANRSKRLELQVCVYYRLLVVGEGRSILFS